MKNPVKYALFLLGIVGVAPMAMAAGDATAGAEKVAVCAACHSTDGNSPAPNFPKIAGLGERYLLKQLRDIQAWDLETDPALKEQAGRVVLEMTGMLAGYNDQDLQDIAAYFASQSIQLSGSKELKVRVNAGLDVDALELGEKIFRAGNLGTGVPACSGCHAPDAHGNAPAGYPRLSGQYPEYIEKQLLAFRAGNRVNDGEQMTMRLVAEKMSDAEIKAVANFIAGLN
ncbi:c-type cytochrome [Cellvibrio polysaccharolyticus]|uniref:Cytochrome c4 n=1 Tax=Cellvibrio polysaccharolyticus TaxID=2082724 RepID=A0A928V9M7_9GAMM|nr:c-type cytochrome [Cellvibrio polysaccharolyticus]MBE8719049.1 cytochrome c4 [Cellvibrio polysaccharolyticus]